MFREMRRKKQALSEAETIEILINSTSGVLAVSGDDGYPYAVPVSHIYHDSKLYFHCAVGGHKIDSIRRNDKVSFCVIAQDIVMPEKRATDYRSAVVFGRARILEEPAEKRLALEHVAAKFAPGFEVEARQEIERLWDETCVVEILIEQMTGKSAIKN
jgi:uncharacterized protein